MRRVQRVLSCFRSRDWVMGCLLRWWRLSYYYRSKENKWHRLVLMISYLLRTNKTCITIKRPNPKPEVRLLSLIQKVGANLDLTWTSQRQAWSLSLRLRAPHQDPKPSALRTVSTLSPSERLHNGTIGWTYHHRFPVPQNPPLCPPPALDMAHSRAGSDYWVRCSEDY